MRKQFSLTVADLAAKDDRIVVILGDISVFLFNDFKEKFPNRFFNLGICENAIIGAAAGLSSQGFIPFVHTIAPFFVDRSYEHLKLDACYNQFPINIVTCGASFDYAWDGPSHHCYGDLATLRLLPGMQVFQPGSPKEIDALIRSQYNIGKSNYFRLADKPHDLNISIESGKALILQDKNADATIMTAGPLIANVLEACRDLNVNIVYFNTIKPIDKAVVSQFKHTRILVIHDAFGFYEAVSEIPNLNIAYHGLPADTFLCSYGSVPQIRKLIGLDSEGIRNTVLRTFGDKLQELPSIKNAL
ncbi:MAG: hypothetical protein HY401_00155 [Elusimicrobia bacterium]|nr:hypothetical protein [Elusimicrobiota bacterium]